MNIIGLSAFVHDSAACLIMDGRLVASAEEERFNRVKHTDGFPQEALDFVLAQGGITMADVDVVAFNWHPWLSLISEIGKFLFIPPIYRKTQLHMRPPKNFRSIGASFRLGRELRRRYPGQFRARIEWVAHHHAHAASAYYLAGWQGVDATALVVDGHGDDSATSLFVIRGNRFRRVRVWAILDSLGVIYSNFTRFLGFGDYQEGKTMALAAFGSNTLSGGMEKVIALEAKGSYRVANKRYLGSWYYGNGMIAPEFGSPRPAGSPLTQAHYDLAHSMQTRVKQAVLHILRYQAGISGGGRLALAGGLFLNCDLNRDILASGLWAEVFVPPFCSDSGGAVGAGLYAACSRHGELPPADWRFSPYLGPGYSDAQLRQELGSRQLVWRQLPEPTAAAAACLKSGGIIGWFQGRMEGGPRALGNRSILADPGKAGIQDDLNLRIKRREPFRPFAPIATPAAAVRFFDLPEPIPTLARYMLLTVQVRPEYQSLLAGITHVDGSARIQVVSETDNPLLHRLLVAFGGLSGYEVLLNTSFNRQEPIVCSPADALNCFEQSGLDRLYAGSFEIDSPVIDSVRSR